MTQLHPLDAQIRAVLADHGRLNQNAETIAADDDLYQAGMTSHASVNVMLALEGTFEVEFPDHMLTRKVFASVETIRSALIELGVS